MIQARPKSRQEMAQHLPYASAEAGELERAMTEFARRASTEISTHDEGLLPEVARELPAGTSIYVAHTPKASLEDVVRVAIEVQSLGFRASPHIVARRLPRAQALESALSRLREHGVSQVLLVAGDLEQPIGPFRSTLEIIDSGAIERAGLERVGVAGHPEGHPAIGAAELLRALRHKQEFGRSTGVAVHVVTQFGFNPGAVTAWQRHLAAEGIALPVHVGIAGPAPLTKLIRFAVQCGVGTSLHALRSMGSMVNLARLVKGPEEMLAGLARGGAADPGSALVQPHFYAFGGILGTARWLRAMMKGDFRNYPIEE